MQAPMTLSPEFLRRAENIVIPSASSVRVSADGKIIDIGDADAWALETRLAHGALRQLEADLGETAPRSLLRPGNVGRQLGAIGLSAAGAAGLGGLINGRGDAGEPYTCPVTPKTLDPRCQDASEAAYCGVDIVPFTSETETNPPWPLAPVAGGSLATLTVRPSKNKFRPVSLYFTGYDANQSSLPRVTNFSLVEAQYGGDNQMLGKHLTAQYFVDCQRAADIGTWSDFSRSTPYELIFRNPFSPASGVQIHVLGLFIGFPLPE